MTGRVGLWVAGAAGSILAHGVLLGVLIVALRPEPVTEQTMPTSELEIDAYQLDRTQAQERRPIAEAADAQQPDGAKVAADTIPKSTASAVQAPADQVAPSAAQPDRLAAEPAHTDVMPAAIQTPERLARVTRSEPAVPQAIVTSTALASTAIPTAATASRVTPTPTSLAVAEIPAVAAAIAVAAAPAVVPQIRPDTATITPAIQTSPSLPHIQTAAARVQQLVVTAPSVPQTAPNTQSAPRAEVTAQPAASAPADGQKLKAALAFSGASDGDVDPVSLAAFQSFMQPGDIQADADPLRDGVSALLAQVPCSRLQVGFDPDTATLQVNGHIPEGDLRAPVLATLKAQMGSDITVSDNILILPRPQCGALSGIGSVGLPQSTDQITNPLLIGADTHARVLDFVRDDRLYFDLSAPDYDAYVYVDYFDAGGDVLHLSPNNQSPLQLTAAETAFRVGARQDGDAGLQIFIGPPYGQEIAVAFAASEPLYDGVRPIVEPAAPYLEWLKSRVTAARARHPDFKGEWVYFFVTTTDK